MDAKQKKILILDKNNKIGLLIKWLCKFYSFEVKLSSKEEHFKQLLLDTSPLLLCVIATDIDNSLIDEIQKRFESSQHLTRMIIIDDSNDSLFGYYDIVKLARFQRPIEAAQMTKTINIFMQELDNNGGLY